MNRYLVIFSIISFFTAFSQTPQLDSLKQLVKSHKQADTFRVSVLNELSFRIFKVNSLLSYEYADSSLALAQTIGFRKGIAMALNNLAVYHTLKGKDELALQNCLESISITENTPMADQLANSYAILGTVYYHQKNYTKAIQNLKMAQQLNIRIHDPLVESRVLNSRGLILIDQGKYDSALYYFLSTLRLIEETHEIYRKPEVINNIGLAYTWKRDTDLALKYYRLSLAEARRSFSRRAEGLALYNIGNTILAQQKYEEAEKYFLESLEIVKQTGETKLVGGNYMSLGQLKNETGKFDKAHYYISRFYEVKDSLLNLEKVKKIAELEVQYETAKKEHAIQILERDSKIQKLWTNVIIAVLGLISTASVLYYIIQQEREKKKRIILNLEIEQLTTQNKELSEKYKSFLASADTKIESLDQRLLKNAIASIEKNLNNSLFGVEEMANELSMSRANLHRKMKAITGFPPSELIRNIRLRKAADLLISDADTISQIAFRVGFDDHSHFTKSFKKQFGQSPSEYLQSKKAS